MWLWWRQWWGYEVVLWHNRWEIARLLAAIACECPFAKHQVSKVISVYVCACLHTTQTGWDTTKFSVMQVFKNLLIGYIIAIIDVLFSMFTGLTKFQKWAKGISIFLLINKVFKTSNWKQLLLWPMAKDFCETSMTKGKLFSLEMHFKQAIWEQTIFYVSGIPRWNFGFKIRRCDCAFTVILI